MDKIVLAIYDYVYRSTDEQSAFDEILNKVIDLRQTFVNNNKPSVSKERILVDMGVTK